MENKHFITEKNISSMLVSLALPAMAAGFIDITYNVVDSIFIGHFVGRSALAALSLISSIQLFFISVGQLFAVGSSSIISRALGANKPLLAKTTLKHGFWASLIFSAIVSFTLLIRLDDFLMFLGANPDTLPYARSYGGIILWTAFLGPVNNILMSSLRAKGELPLATRYVFIGAITNIILDAIFIVGFRWGGAGAAAATALSQIVVLIFALRRVRRTYDIHMRLKERYSFAVLREIAIIGLPSSIRTFLFSFQLTLTNKNLSVYGGVTALSAFGITQRIMPLAGMLIFGISQGGQPLIGMNYGAKLYLRTLEIMRLIVRFAMCLSIPFSIFFMWAPAWVFYVFTRDPEIIAMGQVALRYGGIFHFFWSYFAVTAEILQSMGRARQSLILVGTYPLLLVAGQSTLPHFFGLTGVWLSQPIGFTLIFILAYYLLHKNYQYLKKQEEIEQNAF
ncbi:MAG: MATE family efflux transporter [Brevinema sp.]